MRHEARWLYPSQRQPVPRGASKELTHMYLNVALGPQRADLSLEELDDLKNLKVVVTGTGDLGVALAGAGTLAENGDVFLSLSTLKQLAGARAEDAVWLKGFEEMTDYAGAKGWLSEDGKAVRAHCERRG